MSHQKCHGLTIHSVPNIAKLISMSVSILCRIVIMLLKEKVEPSACGQSRLFCECTEYNIWRIKVIQEYTKYEHQYRVLILHCTFFTEITYIIICTNFLLPIHAMLVQGNNRMIYAWSADGTDPADHDSVMYHMSNRGTQGVVFVQENEVVSDLENAESVTFLANNVSCSIDSP